MSTAPLHSSELSNQPMMIGNGSQDSDVHMIAMAQTIMSPFWAGRVGYEHDEPSAEPESNNQRNNGPSEYVPHLKYPTTLVM
jgi:hypothetical protein